MADCGSAEAGDADVNGASGGADDKTTGGRVVMKIFPLACSATRYGQSEMTDATTAPLHCSSAHLQAGREEDKGPSGLLQR